MINNIGADHRAYAAWQLHDLESALTYDGSLIPAAARMIIGGRMDSADYRDGYIDGLRYAVNETRLRAVYLENEDA